MEKVVPEKGIRNRYSQAPFQIFMYDQAGMTSTGSAFFYEFKSELYLITNWHNLSGRHFLTKEPLSGRFPTHIDIKLATYVSHENGDRYAFTAVAHKLEIYQDCKPIWFVHPEIGEQCDVVAIKILRPAGCAENFHLPVNHISRLKIPVKPGNTAFVIGFPSSLSTGFGLPLWKSGFIASEPHFGITSGGQPSPIGGLANGIDLPAFFLDTQTRQGMSGAPVFCSFIGTWNVNDPYEEIDVSSPGFWDRDDVAMNESRMEFIGCYSGRIGRDEEGAALGICWGVEVIEKICAAAKIGKNPHFNELADDAEV
ncbi:trypsin-like peptidase domain-containing protein [Pseudomonas chlororaphis]|uniref:trypsin-like peptidase domain-containing protein n=1 Tax=Pseudomonas chlororaphis TaxID=587753 RepID=UPI0009B8200A|nr:trypsin-like peptidase domain-containing protein [Pseudomonas chlororaphis]